MIFFCSWLSNDTSTNSYGLYRLNKGTQLSDLWIDQDRNPKGPFTKMNIPMLAIIHVRLPWVPWPLSPSYNDGHNLYLWRSSTSRHQQTCRDLRAPWLRIPWLSDKCRSGVQSRHTGTTHMFPVWLVHLGGQELGLFFSAPSPFEGNEINRTWGMAELREESGNI